MHSLPICRQDWSWLTHSILFKTRCYIPSIGSFAHVGCVRGVCAVVGVHFVVILPLLLPRRTSGIKLKIT